MVSTVLQRLSSPSATRAKARSTITVWKRFLLASAATVFVALSPLLVLNILVDPLWYFQGNLLTKENFAFNERVAKLNRILANLQDVDCLILGSSRVTLLDESLIQGYTCFNLSFSSGRPDEFLAFSRYLKDREFRPRLVIVGVDPSNFHEREYPIDVPKHVRRGESPPWFVLPYLALDTTKMTLRTLRARSPMPRYYDDSFHGRVRAGLPAYVPEKKDCSKMQRLLYTEQRVVLYAQLPELFPTARVIGYVPPQSAWRFLSGPMGQEPLGYASIMLAVARNFEAFFDFAVPTAVTQRTDNTYDGSHHDAQTNAMIARSLVTGAAEFGVRVDTKGDGEYRAYVERAVDEFRGQYEMDCALVDKGKAVRGSGKAR